ncbi:hypothetical protein [Neobacillus niacini]|uniref:hypothetical protein n=1 Tax=Neobacillus niacini TaxID=86668 RepID=UPI003982EDEC
MENQKKEYPIWAWFVLIGGGLFLLKAMPGMLLTITIPIWKPDEISFFTFIYIPLVLGILGVTLWGLKKAFSAIKGHQKTSIIPTPSKKGSDLHTSKKPVWPWVVIGAGAVLVIGTGPAALMLPIMPLFLAGMSTDSSDTPSYVPLLIMVVGYGLMIGYTILLVKAIKRLRAK